MACTNISHLALLLQALSDRMIDLKHDVDMLYVNVELTRDLWHKIEALYQQEGWDLSQTKDDNKEEK